MKKKILMFVLCMGLFTLFNLTFVKADYGTGNRGWVIEIQPITYEGHAQCKPSSWYQGKSPSRCYIRFTGGRDGDTGRIYSRYGKSKNDGNTYSVMKYHYDSWSLTAPKTKFYYGFDWVSTSSNLWPV